MQQKALCNECGTIARYVDVKKAIEWLLSGKMFSNFINPDKRQISIYSYTDAFPWMAWSLFFQGETAILLRIVDTVNTLNFIITVGSWLGPDDYQHVTSLGSFVYKQLSSLKSISVEG